jgi:hypothetical protein
MAGCELIALSIIALKKIDVFFKEIYSGVFSCCFKIIPENWKYLNPTVSGEPIPFLI